MDAGAVGGVAALLFVAFLFRRARVTPPPAPDGTLVLRHGRPMQVLGAVCVFGAPAVVTVLVLLFPPEPDERVWLASLYLLFIGLGAPLLWEATRFELRVGPDGLDHRSAWLERAAVEWSDIREVGYSSLNGWFLVRTVDGRTRRVSILVPGVHGFLAACEQRLPPGALARARTGYLAVGRPFND